MYLGLPIHNPWVDVALGTHHAPCNTKIDAVCVASWYLIVLLRRPLPIRLISLCS